MPELPEVERFRQTLLNLVSNQARLQIHLPTSSSNTNVDSGEAVKTPPRVWLSADQIALLHDAYHCTGVVRKGKQLCMVLQKATSSSSSQHQQQKNTFYLFLHMGMTGSIRSPGKKICWGHAGTLATDNDDAIDSSSSSAEEAESYPPPYAYLTLECAGYQAAFCDPRKFGKCILMDNTSALDELAPDAWLCVDEQEQRDVVLPKLAHQSMGIKGLLLDQKRACSGVGNWVADEVLYQCHMHPDQTHLTNVQAQELWTTLQQIVSTAVDCLTRNVPYPHDWLFQYRWTGKKTGSKDAFGRSIAFLKSGGRTSAIIPTLQKLYKKSPGKQSTTSSSSSSSRSSKTAKSRTGKQKPAEGADARAKSTKLATKASKKRKVDHDGPSRKAAAASKKIAVSSTTATGKESQQSGRRRSPRFVTP